MNQLDVLRNEAGTGYLRMVIENPETTPETRNLCKQIIKERTESFFLDKEGVKHYFS